MSKRSLNNNIYIFKKFTVNKQVLAIINPVETECRKLVVERNILFSHPKRLMTYNNKKPMRPFQ